MAIAVMAFGAPSLLRKRRYCAPRYVWLSSKVEAPSRSVLAARLSEPIKQEVSGERKGVGDTDSNQGRSEFAGVTQICHPERQPERRDRLQILCRPSGVATVHIGIRALTGRQIAASAQPV